MPIRSVCVLLFLVLITQGVSFAFVEDKGRFSLAPTPQPEAFEKFGVIEFIKPIFSSKKETPESLVASQSPSPLPVSSQSPTPKPQPLNLVIWNRKKAQEEQEKVYGDSLIRWLYGTRVGQGLADHILSSPWVSRIYGLYQSSPLSSSKVQYFIREFNINIDDFEGAPFQSFNDFFIRRYKPGLRRFSEDSQVFPAFAEGRYLAYSSQSSDQLYPVKGKSLSAQGLLGPQENAQDFEGGPLFIARLNPTDYHRFHFPDEGRVLRAYTIHGSLQSVNPIALSYNQNILIQNERKVSILQTKNFGKIAYIEVGAMCVGKIIETHGLEFQRGDQKGYFLFGGSTVIVMGQPGAWIPSQDLLEQTARGRETLVLLGDQIGEKSTPQEIRSSASTTPLIERSAILAPGSEVSDLQAPAQSLEPASVAPSSPLLSSPREQRPAEQP